MNLDDDKETDFFEDEVPDPVKEEKKPVYTPDDPRYWEQPEDPFSHLTPSRPRRRRIWWWAGITAVLIGALEALYVRYFVPCVTEACETGYVDRIEKSGQLLKSYEGVLLPYKNLMDTLRPYEGDFRFSTTDTDVAVRLKKMHFANLPVRVHYKVYRTAVPWRGETEVYITAVDSVNPRDILPPDRQPEFIRSRMNAGNDGKEGQR